MADPNNSPQPPARTPSKPSSSSQIPVRTTPGPSVVPALPRIYTPGPGARAYTPGARTPRGLLISAHNTPNPNATPHVRAAYRAIDSRRAAILTPHHARRRSLREARETPRNFLLQLGKVLASKSERIPSSSSSPGSGLSGAAGGGGQEEGDTSEELTFDISTRSRYGDDDEEELPKRPRLSLPLGGGGLGDMEEGDWEDDDLPQPHRSAGLEDLTENFTVQSIELPRRVDAEKDGRMRDSMGRLSDFPQLGGQQQQSDGIDSGFFPPAAIDEDEFGNTEDRIPDEFSRLDSDETRRRETIGGEGGLGLLGAGGRDSDFHIEVPVGMDESTFMIASPTRQFEMGQAAETAATSGQGGGFAELMDRRSDSYDNDDDDGNDIGPTFDDYDNDDGIGMDLDNNNQDQDQAAGSDEEMPRLSGYTPTAARVSLSASAAREKLGFFREEGGERGGFSKIKATKKISKHSIEYTSLPPAMVKRLAQTFAKTSGAKGNISPEALKAIMQASDWFFEQLGDDLSAYAKHAHRKTIDMSDMLTLMKRQRQTNAQTTPFALAQRYLPRELLQELRMTPPVPVKKRRKAASSSRAGVGGEDEEVT